MGRGFEEVLFGTTLGYNTARFTVARIFIS